MANQTNDGGGGGTGTVKSVGLTMPDIFAVANTPIVKSGVFGVTFNTQVPNLVFAGPASGGSTAPGFRALVASDIPALDASKITSGVFDNARINWGSPSAIGGTTPAAITGTTINGTIITASTAFVGSVWAPGADSIAAQAITKADKTTSILRVDSTNSRIGLGPAAPKSSLDIGGEILFFKSTDTVVLPALLTTNTIIMGGDLSIVSDYPVFGLNTYYSSGFKYMQSGRSAFTMGLTSNPDVFAVQVAPSGTAGAAVTLVAALSISNVGVTTLSAKDAVTAAVTNVAILDHSTSGTPAAVYGTGLAFKGQSSTTVSRDMGRVRTEWTTATDASRASKMVLSTYAVGVESDTLALAPTTAQINVGSSFITFTPNSGTIRWFYSGQYDGLITLGNSSLTFNGVLYGTGHGITGASTILGQNSLNISSANGSDNYTAWSEEGVQFRGALGFKAGSSTLIYRPAVNNLASGTTVFSIDSVGLLTLRAGTSTGTAKVGGTAFDHTTDAGNTTVLGADDSLYSDTVAASTLGTNADKITAYYGGTFVSSGTATRKIKVWFAGTAIFDTGALTISLSAAWTIYVDIIRVSSTVIRYMISLATEGAALSAYTAVGELTGLTLSGTNILKITGAAAGVGAAANDIVAKMGSISWYPAA